MSGGRRILIVDADPSLRDMLNEQLAAGGDFIAVDVRTGGEALEQAKDANFFVAIVLDVGLPDRNGRDVCRLLRQAGVGVPIILLTGTDDTDAGPDADDAIAKPVRIGVLLARLRAAIGRRERSAEAETVRIGPFEFQPEARLLVDATAKATIRLTDKEAAILKFLFRAAGRVVARDELLGEVWGYNAEVMTHTLETHVYRLRQKIERDPADARILVSALGGYRLVR